MKRKYTKYENPFLDPNIVILAKIFVLLFFIALLIFRNTQDISERMFWTDEVIAFKTSIKPILEIPNDAIVSHHQMQPPIFYWLGHLASKLGTDTIILRSVSVSCYLLMILFIVYNIKELHYIARYVLIFILLISPFARYAVTEFRPYALAALSILFSSVFLYRFLKNPDKWEPSVKYAFSALLLHYSLTLNCFVFGVQMIFIIMFLLKTCMEEGFWQVYKKLKPCIFIPAILCIQYSLFLAYVVSKANGIRSGTIGNYVEKIESNTDILIHSFFLRLDSITSYIIVILFICGIVLGLKLKRYVTLYLLSIFLGQIAFSTYVTFATIPWFAPRYAVASYVTYALICSMGADIILNILNKKIFFPIVAVFLVLALGVMRVSAIEYGASLQTKTGNPSKDIIDHLKCKDRKTIIVSEPRYISLIPWYIFRHDDAVHVPDPQIDWSIILHDGLANKACFILQEFRDNKNYRGDIFRDLISLQRYSIDQFEGRPGTHVPASAWLFTPTRN